MSEVLWLALAMVLVLEGIGPMLFPKKWQRYMQQLSGQPPEQLRTMGGVMVTIGLVALFYLLK
ncbi:DUF2065 domain-containing protein [Bowmanella dokdonensis]|uniref:DUF2065 domain-containing protein n=1 Tax=Bowmanella dokdonensis TaxID=751969 RepID=A0A939DJK3_9ALTE|nr:DUF2065 domain-containing protein [Bowmanella dokdonensis]MBN7823704.1 DUF2065 domain-containing protein [Bowmanella dokdonensis]